MSDEKRLYNISEDDSLKAQAVVNFQHQLDPLIVWAS